MLRRWPSSRRWSATGSSSRRASARTPSASLAWTAAAEWGGSAFDPDTGLLYVNSNEMVWLYALAENPKPGTAVSGKDLYRTRVRVLPPRGSDGRAAGDSLARGHRQADDGGRSAVDRVLRPRSHAGVPHVMRPTTPTRSSRTSEMESNRAYPSLPTRSLCRGTRSTRFTGHHKFLDIDGYPAITPPWGTLNAINMNTGEYAWKIPLGEYPELVAKGLTNTGSENYGGPIVTAGGLVFIAATNYDKKFRAFDKSTGKLVWETTLPFTGNATPATYEVNGRQYIVIATSGAGRAPAQRNPNPAKPGGRYVAFALPSGSK